MTDQTDSTLHKMLLGVREASRTFDGIQIGSISRVTDAGAYFTVPSFDTAMEYGPAPYPGTTEPPAGTSCAVVFVGTGVSQPLILTFYGWPT
jgi:hypothetical protein